MTDNLWRRFALEDLRVISIRGDQDDVVDEHFNWYVSFTKDVDEEFGGRVIIATMHAALSGGRADVTVGGVLLETLDSVVDELTQEQVANTAAVESLWDYARTVGRGVLGFLDIDGAVPLKSPAAELDYLPPRPHDDTAIDSGSSQAAITA